MAALIQGSRSDDAMARQLARQLSAARFSLLLSVPVIGRAVVLKTINLFTAEAHLDISTLAAIVCLCLFVLLGLSAG